MIYRVKKNKSNPYAMLDKTFLNDVRLSWQAKGMLAYLLSLPDDWKIHEAEIQTHSNDGIKCTGSCIKELIDKGYIKRERIRNNSKQFAGYEYSVYEIPAEMPFSENGKRQNTNNNITNISGKGLEHVRKRYYYNGKRVSKEEYQAICISQIKCKD